MHSTLQTVTAEAAPLFHPAANLVPMMSVEEFTRLLDDIRKNGLEVPIVYYQSKILDGRNRYVACKVAGVEETAIDLDDTVVTDPVAYVLSLNLNRRHLNESQRAIVGAKVLNHYKAEAKERMKRKPRDSAMANLPQQTGAARDQAGAAVKVSGRSIDKAAAVLEQGAPEVIAAVEAGELSVSKARKIVDLPVEEQAQAIDSDFGILAPQEFEPRSAPKPEDDFACDDSPGAFFALSDQLRKSIQKVQDKWPQEHRMGLASKLRCLGDEIEKHGGLIEDRPSRSQPDWTTALRTKWATIHVRELVSEALHQCRCYSDQMTKKGLGILQHADEMIAARNCDYGLADLTLFTGVLDQLDDLRHAHDEAVRDEKFPEEFRVRELEAVT